MVKFVNDNAQTCGVPPEAVTQMKPTTHDHEAQTQICAPPPVPRSRGPSLSEALGTARGGSLDPTPAAAGSTR